MLLKKYRIGPVSQLRVMYKRVNVSNKILDQEYICSSLCGIGKGCKNKYIEPIYSRSYNYYSLCTTIIEILLSLQKVRTKNITYVPWRFL